MLKQKFSSQPTILITTHFAAYLLVFKVSLAAPASKDLTRLTESAHVQVEIGKTSAGPREGHSMQQISRSICAACVSIVTVVVKD